jgi:hypothetical protein
MFFFSTRETILPYILSWSCQFFKFTNWVCYTFFLLMFNYSIIVMVYIVHGWQLWYYCHSRNIKLWDNYNKVHQPKHLLKTH